MKQLVFEKLWGKSLEQRINHRASGLPSPTLDLGKDPPPIPLRRALIKGVKFHKPSIKHCEVSLCAIQLVFFPDVYFYN